ncbi:MAG: methyltransferase [Pseudomonadota bacterium]
MPLPTRFLQWRNRLVANPKFQNWAASMPIIRRIADARARGSFDLAAGFVYTQILRSCVELDLLPFLASAPKSVDEIAAHVDLPRASADRLAKAAAAIDLFEKTNDGAYVLGLTGAAFLGNPSVFAMVRHHDLLYRDLVDPVAALRERRHDTALASFWKYAGAEDNASVASQDVADYSQLMAETQSFIARDVFAAYPLNDVKMLMDVGGGQGAFLAAALETYPSLKGVLCDLPPVADRARMAFEAKGLADRAETVGCDFLSDALPDGADVISLIRILHDHDDAPARRLLSAAHAALAPGGRILIAEPLAGVSGAEPAGDAYFGMYLWAMGSGRPRTRAEIAAMLTGAGFVHCKTHRTRRPLLCSVLTAQRL